MNIRSGLLKRKKPSAPPATHESPSGKPPKEPPSPVTDVKKLAAAAYGEASTDDNPNEVAGIAWAIMNRARAWDNQTVDQILAQENYVLAVKNKNDRYKRLIKASEREIANDKGMSLAMEGAKNALENSGTDPSNGAYWWDGLDFKTNYKKHRKVKQGFIFSDPAHNIFGVDEKNEVCIKYENIRNKKTKKVARKECARYGHVWESTAAHGKTIFWKLGQDFLKVSRGKDYL